MSKPTTNKELRDQFRNYGFLFDGWFKYMYLRFGELLSAIPALIIGVLIIGKFALGLFGGVTKEEVLDSHRQAGALMGIALACNSDDQLMKINQALLSYQNKVETYQQLDSDYKLYLEAVVMVSLDETHIDWEEKFKKAPKSKYYICEESGLREVTVDKFINCIAAAKAKYCLKS